MAATAEVLPPGNEWEFSARNSRQYLQPGRSRKAISQPIGVLHDVVQHIQERFIVEGWNFASLVQVLPSRSDNRHHLITILTHPSRTDLIKSWKHEVTESIKPEIVRTSNLFHSESINQDPIFGRFDTNDPINKVLRGTDFIADRIRVGHNAIEIGEEGFWQTGVYFFDISLSTYEEVLSGIDADIEKLMKKVHPLQEERAVLEALQSPNPTPLFQTG